MPEENPPSVDQEAPQTHRDAAEDEELSPSKVEKKPEDKQESQEKPAAALEVAKPEEDKPSEAQ